MELSELIAELATNKVPITDRPALLAALQELDRLVGMTSVKAAITEQLQFLLANIASKGLDHATDGHLLHTIVYGPPGVGKTLVGNLLARIWAALGILKRPAAVGVPPIDPFALHRAQQDKIDRALVASKAEGIKLQELRRRIFAGRNRARNRAVSLPYTEIQRHLENYDHDVTLLARISAELQSYNHMILRTLSDPSAVGVIVPSPQPLIYKVVSRVDFIGEYVGQTAPKTRKLLEDHRGGVLFVDEAYSLYHGERDTFGSEALTVLNQYMTEHSDETVLILAGYKEILQNSIFRAQPGLARRIAFTFEIPAYTPQELAQIFHSQVLADGWEAPAVTELESFFTTHYAAFPSFGGDTKRLIFQCKIVHNAAHWRDTPEASQKLSLDTLITAFDRYRQYQPLSREKLLLQEQRRTLEEELLQERIVEFQERKAHTELYKAHRALTRKELQEKLADAELTAEAKEVERRGLQKRLAPPPDGIYL